MREPGRFGQPGTHIFISRVKRLVGRAGKRERTPTLLPRTGIHDFRPHVARLLLEFPFHGLGTILLKRFHRMWSSRWTRVWSPRPPSHASIIHLRHVFRHSLSVVLGMNRDRLLDESLDFAQMSSFMSRAERDCDAGCTSPPRSPDAMDIRFRLLGKIEVEHVRDATHIDPA